jgi:hypothetical protein
VRSGSRSRRRLRQRDRRGRGRAKSKKKEGGRGEEKRGKARKRRSTEAHQRMHQHQRHSRNAHLSIHTFKCIYHIEFYSVREFFRGEGKRKEKVKVKSREKEQELEKRAETWAERERGTQRETQKKWRTEGLAPRGGRWWSAGRHGQAPSGAASLSAEKNLDTKKARVVKTPVSLAPARARASHQSTVKNLQFKSIFLFFHVFFFLLL